jgi:multiple sugar transport system permease protein
MALRPTSLPFWPRVKKVLAPTLLTGFSTILIALFLMPFLFMIFTSLKTNAQMTELQAPIWPATSPKYTLDPDASGVYTVEVNKAGTFVAETIDLGEYAGQDLPQYYVPMEDGSTREFALLKGFAKGSIFIDPQNPEAGPIVWNGGSYRGLTRPWVLSPTWSNYADMWDLIDFPLMLWNTAWYALTTTVGVLVSCILVAYGFSRFRFPGRDLLFMVLLSVLFLPGTVTIIPTFTFFSKIGWVGTWAPLIVPAFFANPYDTFLLRQFFMTLPRELDESAMMDGATPLRILWSIIIPQSYPVIVAVTVFHIVWSWNDYFGPLIYLTTKMELQPVSVALARFNSMYGSKPELIQAGALVTLIIPLILFIIAQRFFVQGIVISGVEK